MKRLISLVGFVLGGILLIVVYDALEHPRPQETAVVTSAPIVHANAVAKSLNAAPGAIVCQDLETVGILFRLYSEHWEEAAQDRLTQGSSRQLRGEPAPAPDPSLYNCHLLAPGTPVRVENADAFTTGFPAVTAQLPDGAVIHGVTLPSMLSISQPHAGL